MIEVCYIDKELILNQYSNGNKMSKVIFNSLNKITSIEHYNTLQMIVVLFESKDKNNENVICVNYNGELVWKVPSFEHIYKDSSYTSITQIDAKLIRILNWDSSYWVIKVKTGEVVLNPNESMEGRRPW